MLLKKVCKFFKDKNKLGEIKGIKDITTFFKKLSEGIANNEPAPLIIAEYLHNNIASEKVRKRKSSAREFEDFLDIFMDGSVTDENTRKNISLPTSIKGAIASYLSSNRREKADIKFPSGYLITLKTSVPSNKEINMGSFAREALFQGYLSPKEYGGERKGGLGSKPQMEKIFQKIYNRGLWESFAFRFKLMVENIYVEDMIFAIKGGDYLKIYCIQGESIRKNLIGAVCKGPKTAITVINRYEGNSLRIERDKIINTGEKITLDFSGLEKTIVRKVLKDIEEIKTEVICSLIEGKSEGLQEFIQEKSRKLLNDMKAP
ncbi:MAG: hypothetical protein ABIB71_05835 [Candidatus Woesearchaeota archaeon]